MKKTKVNANLKLVAFIFLALTLLAVACMNPILVLTVLLVAMCIYGIILIGTTIISIGISECHDINDRD